MTPNDHANLVNLLRAESSASGSVLEQTDVALLPREKWQERGSWYPIILTLLLQRVDVIISIVLVLAGVLKAQQLLADPLLGHALGFPRGLLVGATAFELAFGCWLLAGLYRRLSRWLALLWFTSLAAVALAEALGGATSCACFGKLPTHPWLMFLFDVAAVAALWMWSPNGHSSQRLLPVALGLSLLLAAGLFGLVSAPHDQSLLAEIDLGDIARGGQKKQTFQFRNDTGASMEVAAIETSCPCGSIHLEQTDVPAGQFLAGNVTLDLQRKPDFVGNLAIEARGLARRGGVAFVVVIRARVHPASQVETGSLKDGSERHDGKRG